jgi:hypothetical protein
MAILALTSENVAFTKAELRAECHNVKSSHLSEALAKALGFQSHAALLEKQRATRTVEVVSIDEAGFDARLLEFGVKEPAHNALIEIVRSPCLPQPLWREFEDRIQTTDPWFYDCKDRNIPFIK